MEQWILSVLDTVQGFPLWAFALFMCLSGAIELFFPPYPSHVVLLFGSVVAGTMGFWDKSVIYLAFLAGVIASSIALMQVGWVLGDKVHRSAWFSRTVDEESYHKFHDFILQRKLLAFILCKFIPGINSAVLLVAGAVHYPRKEGRFGITLAALIHTTLLFVAGITVGGNLEHILNFVKTYSLLAAGVCLAIIAIYLVFFFRHKKKTS
ncbi:DedA family protein [Gehongia tenuis]|uniref:VTT domain-containing protein n=1 Tax=Gehongia tenuis TaxID=2763655 RepID=A0A926HQT7_9FIRM|nr:hypothetical protein [Gehongia tenuis]MBC8532085.1 hypothetical protein [Gehongia tenuis]